MEGKRERGEGELTSGEITRSIITLASLPEQDSTAVSRRREILYTSLVSLEGLNLEARTSEMLNFEEPHS